MNRYWDALARAAAGSPGLAEPRARSLFEPDHFDPDADLEVIDQEFDAAAPSAATVPLPAATAVTPPPSGPQEAALGTAANVAPRPAARDELDWSEPAGPVTRSAEPVDPAPPRRAEMQPAVEARETRTRIETRRLEVRERVTLAVPAAAGPVAIPAAPPAEASEPAAAAAVEPASPPIVAAWTPTVAAAEPLPVPARPDRRAAAEVEPAPLVIEIDRIDIRIVSDVAPAPATPRIGRAPLPSLEDFLSRGGGARR